MAAPTLIDTTKEWLRNYGHDAGAAFGGGDMNPLVMLGGGATLSRNGVNDVH